MSLLPKGAKRYFRPHRWTLLTVTAVFVVVCIADGFVIGSLWKYIIDDVVSVHAAGAADAATRSTGGSVTILLAVGGGMVALHLLTVAMGAWAAVKLGVVNKQLVFRLRLDLYDKLLRLQMSYHDRHHVGKLISRAVEDVRVLDGQIAPMLNQALSWAGMVLVFAAVLLWLNVKLALAVLAVMPLLFALSARFRKRIKALHVEQRRDTARMYGLSSDRLSHPRVVKGFGQEKREHIRFYRIAAGLFRRSRQIVLLKNGLGLLYTVLTAVGLAVVLGYGAMLVRGGEMSVGALLFAYGATAGMAMPLTSLAQLAIDAQHVVVVFERLLAILGEPVRIADHDGSKDLPAVSKGLEFRDVSMTYEGTHAAALSGVNLHIPAGQRVCLMGPSGAGKSTLAALLLRLYDPSEGQILLDGVDLRDLRNRSLRRHVAYVPQEPMLFSGTLARNIAYGVPDATPEQIVRAAEAAEISGFVETLPEGYQALIGENGLRLSGGQKQRLSLARAFVTDPDVLVLDDCTSALDAHTEKRISRTLKYALAGKTVVMISHRLSTAKAADRIVVLNAGQVVESGTHEELFALRGAYWRLVHEQAGDRPEPHPASATA